jgi:hypothetical protein
MRSDTATHPCLSLMTMVYGIHTDDMDYMIDGWMDDIYRWIDGDNASIIYIILYIVSASTI